MTESPKPKKKLTKKKKIIAVVVAVALVISGVSVAGIRQNKSGEEKVSYATAEKRDIQVALTSTGTIEPADQYDVTSSVNGEIISCTFEEGDVVNEGDVLYTVDSSDVQSNIEQAALSLEKSKISYNQTLDDYEDLVLKANESGVVIKMHVEVGDQVQTGTAIADVQDSQTMILTVPFNADDAKSFSIGQSGTVTIGGSLDTVSCKITDIDTVDTATSANQVIRYVEVSVQNPGGISTSTTGTVMINGVACTSSATFAYNSSGTITADHSGKIVSLSIDKGSKVTDNQKIGHLDSSDLDDQMQNNSLSLQDSQLSYKNAQDKLNDYTITAPITGTVITKNTKLGDDLDASQGQLTLAVIYDLSYLTFDMALDELDINKVSVGQTVQISCDSLDSGMFEGVITKVSVAGTTENGVTSYPVTVQIDNPPEDLLPGMNVDATIIVEEEKNVLSVPVDAVQRGDVVYVKTNNAEKKNSDSKKEEKDTDSDDVPEGYEKVEVKTGISNDTYIQIKSGLSEGDEVWIPSATGNTSTTNAVAENQNAAMGGMPGGMPSGGGMPNGGGMPSGGGMPQ